MKKLTFVIPVPAKAGNTGIHNKTMKKLIAITIAIILAMPQPTHALRPLATTHGPRIDDTTQTMNYQQISNALRKNWLAVFPDDKDRKMLTVKALHQGGDSFDFRADPDYEVVNNVVVEPNEAASMYLCQEGDLIHVKQFTVNPDFYNTDVALELLSSAIAEVMSSKKGARRIQFDYIEPGDPNFLLRVAENPAFMIGPINFEEEFWVLGERFTGEKVGFNQIRSEGANGDNPLILASGTLFNSLKGISMQEESINYEDALGEVEKAMHIVMQALRIDENYALYFPHMDTLARHIVQVIDEQEHIGWRVQHITARPWESRHREARVFSGEKWFFEQAVQGNLSADDAAKLSSSESLLDLKSGTWHIPDRSKTIAALGCYEPEWDILRADLEKFGYDANAITYQAIYAPTLKTGDSPMLLGVIWVTGRMTPFQLRALQSYAFQAGYALEKIYLMYSLKARKEQLEGTRSRLGKLDSIVAMLNRISVYFHDLKNAMFVVTGFMGFLIDAEHVVESDSTERRNTAENDMQALMGIFKGAHADIADLEKNIIFHSLPPKALLASCHTNLAAFLLQIRGYKEHPNAIKRELKAAKPGLIDENNTLLEITVDSLGVLHELYSIVHKLQTAYSRAEAKYAEALRASGDMFPLLWQYSSLPMDDVEFLAAGGSGIEDIKENISQEDYVRYQAVDAVPERGVGPYSMHPLAQNPLILYLAKINNCSVNELISRLVEKGFSLDREGMVKDQAIHFLSIVNAAEAAEITFDKMQFCLESEEQHLWRMLSSDAIGDAKRVVKRVKQQIPQLIERLVGLVEGGSEEEAIRVINLHDIVAEAVDKTREEFALARIQLDYDGENIKEPIMISTRPNVMLNFIILELLRNTIKYMPDEKPERVVKIGYRLEQDGYVRLIIQDTGGGISEEFIRRSLFEKPGAMEKLTDLQAGKLKAGRSGMGLYLARRLLRDLGGDLYVSEEQTAVGVGSCFVIKYPLKGALAANPFEANGQSYGAAAGIDARQAGADLIASAA